MWKNKKVLVTGGLGMIGRELIYLLLEKKVELYVVDIKKLHGKLLGSRFGQADLRDFAKCVNLTQGMDYVFHLAGIKGNVWMSQNEPVDFMGPMLQFNTNMILAAQKAGVKRFLYTSSIAVVNLDNDMYPGWAKLTGEKLVEAMRIQYNGTKYVVVRPANVYGRFDDYTNPEKRGMVITSLISKSLSYPILEVWGDGSDIRDFINSKDVARGMIKAMEEMPKDPVNLCSGEDVTIKELAEIIARNTNKKIKWDTTKPKGAVRRVMKINWDFKPEITLNDGIKEIINHLK